MVLKIVLKVNIRCIKCKTKLLEAVSCLQGVNKVEIDGVKETLTVIGDADPFEVVVQARKVCKFAEIASVGPPEQKKPDEEKKDKPKEEILPIPCPWNACDKMGVVQFHEYDEPATIACSIM